MSFISFNIAFALVEYETDKNKMYTYGDIMLRVN